MERVLQTLMIVDLMERHPGSDKLMKHVLRIGSWDTY